MTQLFFLCLFLLNYFRYCSIVIRSHGYSLACIESVRQCVMGCTVQYVASWVCVLAAGQVDWGPGELGQQPVVLRSHVGQHRLNKNKMSRPLLLRPINMFFKQGREAWFFFFFWGVFIWCPVSPFLRFYCIFHCNINFTLEWSPIQVLTMAQVG